MLRVLIAPLIFLALSARAETTLFLTPQFEVQVQKDVAYGEGVVDSSSEPRTRKLTMDVYQPLGETAPRKRPALVLAFGGFWHRGGKDAAPMHDAEGHQNTPMSGYCQAFAARGYTCFSIDYRLTQEDPGLESPPHAEHLMDPEFAMQHKFLGGANGVRSELGLAPLTDETRFWFWRAIVGSSEDMGKAVAYIRANAESFGIDPERVAVGGWSAGAFTSINLAYGARVPVKAVFANSGGFWGYNLYKLQPATDTPALLLLWGENDIPGLLQIAPAVVQSMRGAGVDSQLAWVPGRGHFYRQSDITLADDGSKMPLLERINQFLFTKLDLARLQ
ncbi:alpha/beta hydrolase [Microbulbifer pacificus]|uniref:alpha/beta hydrolase n=1 Tax=Microbulbifer pacificus TaxID=407164 RepID=UPI001319EC7F|nr:carboxylesterase family protein [Microbulbifer pacificus]